MSENNQNYFIVNWYDIKSFPSILVNNNYHCFKDFFLYLIMISGIITTTGLLCSSFQRKKLSSET